MIKLILAQVVLAVILMAGWANAETNKPGRCVVKIDVVTDPETGKQTIQRKVRCEYTLRERGMHKAADRAEGK